MFINCVIFVLHRYEDSTDIDYEQANLLPRQPLIDARNEQDFPSLGNGPAISFRQAAPLNSRVFGSKGLAKTKENFPALGGLSASEASTNVQPKNTASKSNAATALFKNQSQKPVTNKPKSSQPPPTKPEARITNSVAEFPSLSGASSSSSGFPLFPGGHMTAAKVIARPAEKAPIVKQNPKPSKSAPVTKSPFEFPSLPSGTGNPLGALRTMPKSQPPPQLQKKSLNIKPASKPKPARSLSEKPSATSVGGGSHYSGGSGHSRREIDEDFIESAPTFSMAGVSAKHRALIPSYESVGPGQSGSKINTIQQVESTKAVTNKHVPQINSKENFPSLGKSTAAAPQWLKNGPVKVVRGKARLT